MFRTSSPCPNARWKMQARYLKRIANYTGQNLASCTIAIEVLLSQENEQHRTKLMAGITNFLNEHAAEIDTIIGPTGHNGG
jgi:hypothetical protein